MNYIQIVNNALSRCNEIPITSGSFSNGSFSGPQQVAINAVNDVLNDVYTDEQEWPFNAANESQILIPGQQFYNFPTNFAHVDMDSFYTVGNIPSNSTVPVAYLTLPQVSYETWVQYQQDFDYNTTSSGWGPSSFVMKNTQDQWGVTPPPDQAYQINYTYYPIVTYLVNSTDTPVIPPRYHTMLVEGVMYYIYMFREDLQQGGVAKGKFDKSLGRMRLELIIQPKSMRVR